jgi:hypothetical protein
VSDAVVIVEYNIQQHPSYSRFFKKIVKKSALPPGIIWRDEAGAKKTVIRFDNHRRPNVHAYIRQ